MIETLKLCRDRKMLLLIPVILYNGACRGSCSACLYVLHSYYASINDGKLRKPHITPHLDSAATHEPEGREKLLPVS